MVAFGLVHLRQVAPPSPPSSRGSRSPSSSSWRRPHVQLCALSPHVVPACRASVGSRAARGPCGPDGPEGRSGGTLGRMIVVRHDLDQYHGLDIAFTSRWADGACSEVPHVYVGVCMVSVEPNVSCIHLGRVPSASASSSAVSSRPVASAENSDLRHHEG